VTERTPFADADEATACGQSLFSKRVASNEPGT
jgi:hypothetical protein